MHSRESTLRRSPLVWGGLIAVLAASYQLLLASEPLNDQFMSVVWGREILFGRLPVRDFFEAGEPLTEFISAASGFLVGYRLLAEALIVAVAMGIGTWVVFWVTNQLTGSTIPSALAAVLVAIAGGRSYSYPKILIYAIAAALIWRYIQQQTWQRLATLSIWTGAAFLWRHDHGMYLAFATALTLALAHGFTRPAAVRLALAGTLALAVSAPYLGWVQWKRGVVAYLVDGRGVVASELNDNGSFRFSRWPVRRLSDVVQIDPQSNYAPQVHIKWSAESTSDERSATLARFHLVADSEPIEGQPVRLLDPKPQNIRALLNDPIVQDTNGINRATSSVPYTTWNALDRARFNNAWLRIRLLPVFENAEVAGQAAAWLFFVVVVTAVAWAALPRRNQEAVELQRQKAVGAIAGLALMSLPGLLRQPLSVYAPDVVVLPAILAGWAAWELWRESTRLPKLAWASRAGAVVLCSLLMFSVGGVGRLRQRVDWLAGGWRSVEKVQMVWSDAWERLVVTPPIAYWQGRRAVPATVVLARYVRSCTSEDAPLMVVSFSPDLQFYADRRLASRHLLLGRGRWTSETDQQLSLVKLRNAPPPIVIAQEPFYSATFSRAYPSIADYLRNEYVVSGQLPDNNGHAYLVLSRADLEPSGTDADLGWPCFVPAATLAER
jgi:hypothetical protein